MILPTITTLTLVLPPVGFYLIGNIRCALLYFIACFISLSAAFILATIDYWNYPLLSFPGLVITQIAAAFHIFQLLRNSTSHTSNKLLVRWKSTVAASLLLLLTTPIAIQHFSFFIISAASMAPNAIHGDYVLVKNQTSKSKTNYKRGDIIIFKGQYDDEILIKRVIGVAGDHITTSAQALTINNKQIRQLKLDKTNNSRFRWLQNDRYTEKLLNTEYEILISDMSTGNNIDMVVPDDHYFVLGDNRNQSLDSRKWGAVSADKVIGQPLVIFWSIEPLGNKRIRWERAMELL